MISFLMEIKVIKRDGSTEPFIYEKLVVSALKAGSDIDSARKIAKIIEGKILESGKTEISAKELTKLILEELKRVNQEWYTNWIVFDRAVKRRITEKE